MSLASTATELHDSLELALSCVCGQMEAMKLEVDGYPGCPCWSYVAAGKPAWDNCCDGSCGDDDDNSGQLTVHVEDFYLTTDFPTKSPFVAPCAAAVYAAVVVVTIVRCAPTMDGSGSPPEPDVMTASARLMHLDMFAINQALSCCLPDLAPAGKRKRRVQLTGARPQPPGGGCVGVELRAVVEVGNLCCVTETS